MGDRVQSVASAMTDELVTLVDLPTEQEVTEVVHGGCVLMLTDSVFRDAVEHRIRAVSEGREYPWNSPMGEEATVFVHALILLAMIRRGPGPVGWGAGGEE